MEAFHWNAMPPASTCISAFDLPPWCMLMVKGDHRGRGYQNGEPNFVFEHSMIQPRGNVNVRVLASIADERASMAYLANNLAVVYVDTACTSYRRRDAQQRETVSGFEKLLELVQTGERLLGQH